MTVPFRTMINEINRLPGSLAHGRVTAVRGMLVEVGGTQGALSVGDRCLIETKDRRNIPCEVVGFREGQTLMMPFHALDGVGLGCKARTTGSEPVIFPHPGWLGRVINALGEPVDGKGPLPQGETPVLIRNTPPPAHARGRVKGKVDLGVRCMNQFLTLCHGQRMGIFAGSGVGKSSMLSMMARHTSLDVAVVGLIGERGREAREFIEDDLGEDGMARSVVVVATSDESPLMRRQAAAMTLAVAEYFRDRNRHVLCMMDSVTRFAMAMREITLAAGEPPASKGYTPSVFAELPRLLERAGPGLEGNGSITGLFTVLVEGDDHNEPIADAVRGILDGHTVLDRAIAERGRYPSVNILRSISRTMPACNTPEEAALISRARKLLAVYDDMAELIRLGAYRQGSNAEVDEAIQYFPKIEAFLTQRKDEPATLDEGYAALAAALDVPWGEPEPQQEQPEAAAPQAPPPKPQQKPPQKPPAKPQQQQRPPQKQPPKPPPKPNQAKTS